MKQTDLKSEEIRLLEGIWLKFSVSGSLGLRFLSGKMYLMVPNAAAMRTDEQLVLVCLGLSSCSTRQKSPLPEFPQSLESRTGVPCSGFGDSGMK